MLKVGITGGIGSGKSTVSKVFEVLGIPVYYADDAARRIMNEDEVLKAAIIKEFGEATYTNGALNRSYLAAKVFNDNQQLEKLNALVHPATLRDADNWMKKQNSPYTLKEAALIFESGAQQQLDYVIGVYAPATLRIHRTMKRDAISKEEVTARMDKQMDETIKMKLCDFIITNDEQQALLPQVMQLHEKLLQLSHG